MEAIIRLEQVDVRVDERFLLHDISFEIQAGEMIAMVGLSGSGKTLLGRLVTGIINRTGGNVYMREGLKSVFVEQQDNFFVESGLQHTYFSQRYESFNEQSMPVVAKLLHLNTDIELIDKKSADIILQLKIETLLTKHLLSLSNGERKRVQIASALMEDADLYVFDKPYIGLDTHSRVLFSLLLSELLLKGKTVILICTEKEIPSCCDRVLEIRKGVLLKNSSYVDFIKDINPKEVVSLAIDKLQLPLHKETETFGNVVRMEHVNVKRGDKFILKDINWTVRDHERWLLTGHNGSGKSTLLSLITADNPQAYTNDIVLFGKQRGTGESVWDIKMKIGYVSPEFHLYFLRQTKLSALGASMQHSVDCVSVVVSGFNEEVGFSTQHTAHQVKMAKEWLEALGLSRLIRKQFGEISLGEQRMLLLIRALIKYPPLLILDEPCQGIDHEQSKQFINLLDMICEKLHTTLIYVTHAADEVPSCITHRLELREGVIINNA